MPKKVKDAKPKGASQPPPTKPPPPRATELHTSTANATLAHPPPRINCTHASRGYAACHLRSLNSARWVACLYACMYVCAYEMRENLRMVSDDVGHFLCTAHCPYGVSRTASHIPSTRQSLPLPTLPPFPRFLSPSLPLFRILPRCCFTVARTASK